MEMIVEIYVQHFRKVRWETFETKYRAQFF